MAKLPNPENAVVEMRKLRDYCLSPEHPRGKHKARVFASALNLTAEDSEELRDALLSAVLLEEDSREQRVDRPLPRGLPEVHELLGALGGT